jgi:lysophospholipase L1-like esterase
VRESARAPTGAHRAVRAFVALGDSFSGGTAQLRDEPWPALVAQALGPDVRFLNLAFERATSRDVEERQLPVALRAEPDLVSLICGANDVLESVRPDTQAYAARLSGILERLESRAPGVAVLMATYPPLSHLLPLRPRTRARVERGMREFNAAAREVARGHGALLLEWAEHTEGRSGANVGGDGFHPSPPGHRRAAEDALRGLGSRFGICPRALLEPRFEWRRGLGAGGASARHAGGGAAGWRPPAPARETPARRAGGVSTSLA